MIVTAEDRIPPLAGKLALVTGASGGLGLEAARMLAQHGAHVILAGRNADKGSSAIRQIAAQKPSGKLEFESIDMADLASIASGAARIMARYDRLDILINNAGVMSPRLRSTTRDGFEQQLGTNHLGHFALTGRLLPLLAKTLNARVISVASLAARFGSIDFGDLQSQHGYRPMAVYGQSKLANLLFTRELVKRSAAKDWGILAAAAHPGWSRTNLVANGPGQTGLTNLLEAIFNPFVSQSAAEGALPIIAAATGPDIEADDYVGPASWFGLKGKPALVSRPSTARDDAVARQLWEVSEHLTNVHYPV